MKLLKALELESRFQKKYIPFICLIVILVVILEIWATNRLSTSGVELTKFENSKIALKRENELLEKEIAKKSSLKDNEEISKQLGFDKIKKIEILKIHDLALVR